MYADTVICRSAIDRSCMHANAVLCRSKRTRVVNELQDVPGDLLEQRVAAVVTIGSTSAKDRVCMHATVVIYMFAKQSSASLQMRSFADESCIYADDVCIPDHHVPPQRVVGAAVEQGRLTNKNYSI